MDYTVTSTQMYIMIGIFALFCIETVFFIVLSNKTYLLEYLKVAFLGHKLVIEKLRGGNFYDIRTCKKDGETAINITGKGKNSKSPIFVTPHSMMISAKGKTATYFVASKASFTTNFDFQMIISKLEERLGRPIKDYAELTAAVQELQRSNPEMEIKLPAYKTIALRDLDYYFPMYLNVEDVDALIEIKAKKNSLLDKLTLAKVIPIVVLLIGGAIAYMMIKGDGAPVINVIVDNASRIMSVNAGNAPTQATGFLNTTLSTFTGGG